MWGAVGNPGFPATGIAADPSLFVGGGSITSAGGSAIRPRIACAWYTIEFKDNINTTLGVRRISLVRTCK